MLRNQKLQFKGFIMYCASFKIWSLIEILVPDIHTLEVARICHICLLVCFTLHMFHAFHAVHLHSLKISQIKNSICPPLFLMEGRFKGSLSDKQHALISALAVNLWKHVVLLKFEVRYWMVGALEVYIVFYPRETDVH